MIKTENRNICLGLWFLRWGLSQNKIACYIFLFPLPSSSPLPGTSCPSCTSYLNEMLPVISRAAAQGGSQEDEPQNQITTEGNWIFGGTGIWWICHYFVLCCFILNNKGIGEPQGSFFGVSLALLHQRNCLVQFIKSIKCQEILLTT